MVAGGGGRTVEAKLRCLDGVSCWHLRYSAGTHGCPLFLPCRPRGKHTTSSKWPLRCLLLFCFESEMTPEGLCVKGLVDGWWILGGCSNSLIQGWVNNLVISVVVGTRGWGRLGEVGLWGMPWKLPWLPPCEHLPSPAFTISLCLTSSTKQ